MGEVLGFTSFPVTGMFILICLFAKPKVSHYTITLMIL